MEATKLAMEWAKDEIYSSKYFIYFGLVFISGAVGFWQLGKTDTARAFIYPLLVCGILLVIIGAGLVYSNMSRIQLFQSIDKVQISEFIQSEIERSETTIVSYERVVFGVIPIIITIASILILFLNKPIWRATAIATMGMMAVILLIDSNASARMKIYKENLVAIATL